MLLDARQRGARDKVLMAEGESGTKQGQREVDAVSTEYQKDPLY